MTVTNYNTRVNLEMLNYRANATGLDIPHNERVDLILTCALRSGAPARTRSQARAEDAGAGSMVVFVQVWGGDNVDLN